jgi:TRAP-type C4-dicarboxylate transport system permease small subunit
MKTFQRFEAIFFRISEGILGFLLASMLSLVLMNVVLRYGFGTGISASEELSRTFFVWIVFLGAVVATRDRSHLNVDSLVASLPRKGRIFCALLSDFIVIVCCVLIFMGTWRQHDVSASTLSMVVGMPMIWLYGVGYVLSVGIGLLTLIHFVQLLSGQLLDSELFFGTSQAHSNNTSRGPAP